jgi:hypothetical protein
MADHGRKAERVPLHADIDFRHTGEHRWRVNILDISRKDAGSNCLCVSFPRHNLDHLPGIETLQEGLLGR